MHWLASNKPEKLGDEIYKGPSYLLFLYLLWMKRYLFVDFLETPMMKKAYKEPDKGT